MSVYVVGVGETGCLVEPTGDAWTTWKRLESIINQSNPMSSKAPNINPKATL
jgi:hypothetical protein